MKILNRQRFWDNKILHWEADKYSSPRGLLGALCDVNRSLKNRCQIAQNVLSQIAKDKSVLEIGCGTARLLPCIVQAGATKYVGVDISRVAIEEAKARSKAIPGGQIAEFYHLDDVDLEEVSSDICISLGLFDWLELSEIQQMLGDIQCEYYFHSFSEQRWSLQQLIHKFYVYLFYGHRTKSYVPKYYTYQQMLKTLSSFSKVPPKIFRSRKLSFGSLIYHLPDRVVLENE